MTLAARDRTSAADQAGYLHVDTHVDQISKYPGRPCGDVVLVDRDARWTTLLLADGIGSGVRANLAATLAVHRLAELLRRGVTLRETFSRLVRTMNANRDPSRPFAAFAIGRILPNGLATVLSYEMPPPILIQDRQASVAEQRTFTLERAVLGEASCRLEAGEGLLLVSDGITQAGLGKGMGSGWGADGASRHVSAALRRQVRLAELPRRVVDQAQRYWAGPGDDCSALLAAVRKGVAVNILTGPPADRETDRRVVEEFLARDGLKIVCGGSTSAMLARVLGRKIEICQGEQSLIAPPRCRVEGLDLVTEGVVTLNQARNILGADPGTYEETSGVTELCCLLNVADRVHITVGSAGNLAGEDIAFRQRGLLRRSTVVEQLAEQLRGAGKLVVVESR
jgi:hypothetical protein